MPKTETGEKAYEYCAEYSDMPTRTLARKLRQDWPDLFTSIEHARGIVRDYRGQHGKHSRRNVKHREHFTENGDDRRDNQIVHTIPSARILLFDIETAPHLAYVWRCFKENIAPAQMIQHTTVLCWAAKWLGEKKVFFDSVDPNNYTDDRRICQSLWDLVNEGDIIVAHNGIAFDHKTMRARWVQHGIPPPSPYQMVDTCKLAQKQFNFPRSKLESICQYLGIGGKAHHEGFALWVGCMNGDPKAWATMKRYNIKDVRLLEEVYLRLRSWDKRHPNVSLEYDDVMRCIVCGSTDIKPELNDTRTSASLFFSYRCGSCGHVMRSRSPQKKRLKADERLAHAI